MTPAGPRLLVPSALLSSRWSRDSLLTPEMARLYTGRVQARVDVEGLERALEQLSRKHGAIEVETGSLGVLSWNIRCSFSGQRSLLLVPLARDEEGVGGRSKQRVPACAFEHARHHRALGLGRYLLPALDRWPVPDVGTCTRFALPERGSALTFGLGSARVDLIDEEGAWVVGLGSTPTREVTRELLTALSYHYDIASGSAIVDVLINDGDFIAWRERDGSFALRLTSARRIEHGIEPERFFLYLIQLMAYEDWNIGDDLVGLPVPIADPELAFSAFVKGQGLRSQDVGEDRQAGEDQARQLIGRFGQSRVGRGYRPWVDEFLAGVSRADEEDPRRPWWNLTELEQRRELVRLRAGESAAEPLRVLIERLASKIGVSPGPDEGLPTRVNDFDRARVLAFAEQAKLPSALGPSLADAWFAGWPYRTVQQLERAMPHLPGLESLGASLEFAASSGEAEGTLAALDSLPSHRPVRGLANPEVYGGERVELGHAGSVAELLPSFETFMDDVLHDPRFGYYARRVVIGRGGHFSTHPEDLTPHFGRWIAAWAFEVYRRLVAAGDLAPDEPFAVIELGAGNGRLARDFVDAVRQNAERALAEATGGNLAAPPGVSWRTFAARLDYRICELSQSLRAKQEALLGSDVRIAAGDARNVTRYLEQDFPLGVRGLILSNELPDAFGVHKVLLSPDGTAEATLVLPRAQAELLERLPEWAERIRAADARLRPLLGARPATDRLLDQETFRQVMAAIAELSASERETCMDLLWFDELLVPVSTYPALAAVLERGADEYARALAREDSGVVVYVNVHATNFIEQAASVLSCGQVLTIDYGDTTHGLVDGARMGKFPLRIYCDEGTYHPRPNYPYARPGGQDLTADVNFTDLALAARRAGLDVCYYGPERALAGSELPRVLSSLDQLPLAKLAGNTVFKVLALGRNVDFAPTGSGLDPLPLFFDQPSADAGREQLVRRIRSRLAGPA